jgi:hypothetical protein
MATFKDDLLCAFIIAASYIRQENKAQKKALILGGLG